MDSVLRAAAIYFALLILLKIAGRRAMSELSTFDLVLVLMIGEATQQALLGDDFSVTNAVLVVATLITIDVGLSHLKLRFTSLEKIVDGTPTLVVEYGIPLEGRLKAARLKLEDILVVAREKHGLEHLDQIKFAILEKNGKISIIPSE